MSGILFEQLKSATQAAHNAIEENHFFANIINQTLSWQDYQILLQKLYGFYSATEAHCDLHNSEYLQAINFPARQKLPLLQNDLLQLNYSKSQISNLAKPQHSLDMSNLAHLIGYLYVVEGSTLGNLITSKILTKLYTVDNSSALNYFLAYQPHTLRMWQDFKRTTLHYCGALKTTEVITSALLTFELLNNWLKG